MTIGGKHTVHELSDLWAAYAYEKTQLWNAAEAATADWRAKDDASYSRFSVGQSKLDGRIADLMPRIQAFANVPEETTLGGWDDRVCVDLQGDVFDDLVAAWQGDASTGELGFNALDLIMRQSPVAAQAPSYSSIPQPTAPDLDLDAYKLADAAVKAIEKGAKALAIGTGASLLLVGLLGLGVLIIVKK